jgi:hypothetical protein
MKTALLSLLLLTAIALSAIEPFITRLDYANILGPDWEVYDGKAMNLISTIDGGFLAQLNVSIWYNFGYEFSMTYPAFYKLDANGQIEWSRIAADYENFQSITIKGIVQIETGDYLAVGDQYGVGEDRIYRYNPAGELVQQYSPALPDSISSISFSCINQQEGSVYVGGYVLCGEVYQQPVIMRIDENLENTEYHVIHADSLTGCDSKVVRISPVQDGFLLTFYRNFMYDYRYFLSELNELYEVNWILGIYSNFTVPTGVRLTEGASCCVETIIHDDVYNLLFISQSGQPAQINHSILTNFNTIAYYDSPSIIIERSNGAILIAYSCVEGEIHEFTPSGEHVWSRDNIPDDNDHQALIAPGQTSLLELADGSIVYLCTNYSSVFNLTPLWVVGCRPDGTTGVDDHSLSGTQNGFCLGAFPNPSHSGISLSLSSQLSGEATLNLYNLRGQRILTKSLSLTAGAQTIDLDTDLLNDSGSGVYIARIESRQGQTTTTKFTFIK